MTSPSRRLLASYGATQLIAQRPVAEIARELGSVLIASRRQRPTCWYRTLPGSWNAADKPPIPN